MAAEAATPARADVIDEVFQERGITEPTPTPPAPAESKPPVPPSPTRRGRGAILRRQVAGSTAHDAAAAASRWTNYPHHQVCRRASRRRRRPRSRQSSKLRRTSRRCRSGKRALDAESSCGARRREQSLAFQAATKWKGFKKVRRDATDAVQVPSTIDHRHAPRGTTLLRLDS